MNISRMDSFRKQIRRFLSYLPSNVWQSGFDVSPSGDIAVSCHEMESSWADAMRKKGLLKSQSKGKGWPVVEIWGRDGELRCLDAFENMPRVNSGLRMDAQGSLYMCHLFQIPGTKGPESIEPGAKIHSAYGCLMKLGWKDGKWPLARIAPKGGSEHSC